MPLLPSGTGMEADDRARQRGMVLHDGAKVQNFGADSMPYGRRQAGESRPQGLQGRLGMAGRRNRGGMFRT